LTQSRGQIVFLRTVMNLMLRPEYIDLMNCAVALYVSTANS